MPTLTPEEPDGFFMFLIQMGLAQREVDVLRQRTAHGMEAKMRAGGWPQRAPEGYVNKERQVSSNKYERWVEKDPDSSQAIREAWDMLLTDNYTLDQICEALAERGHIRSSGLPWSWNDPKNGVRRNARAMLQKIFHNPFFAGWVVSQRFGIIKGEVRGQWNPTVSDAELEKGITILRRHDAYKSRNKVHPYLLRGLHIIETNGKLYKMYGSTPRGKTQSYSYYLTQTKIDGKKIRIPCQIVDGQVPEIIYNTVIDSAKEHQIKELYLAEIKRVTHDNREETIASLNLQLARLKHEESRLGRLMITGRISEKAYDTLRKEWQENVQRFESSISELEHEKQIQIDDLDTALHLMTRLRSLYERLGEKERTKLLQILIKQIIVDPQGKIIDIEFNSPFAYLQNLVEDLSKFNFISRCSSQISLGAQIQEDHSTEEVGRFLSLIWFDKREYMDDFGLVL